MTKRERSQQVLRWLAANTPPPYPVHLKFLDGADTYNGPCGYGECTIERGGDSHEDILTISLNIGCKLDDLIHTLVHEYAHAAVWQTAPTDYARDPHCGLWGAMYSELYTAFYDKGGWKESKNS